MKKTIETLEAIIATLYLFAVAITVIFGVFVLAAVTMEQIFVVKVVAAIAYVAFGWLAMLSVEKLWDFLARI